MVQERRAHPALQATQDQLAIQGLRDLMASLAPLVHLVIMVSPGHQADKAPRGLMEGLELQESLGQMENQEQLDLRASLVHLDKEVTPEIKESLVVPDDMALLAHRDLRDPEEGWACKERRDTREFPVKMVQREMMAEGDHQAPRDKTELLEAGELMALPDQMEALETRVVLERRVIPANRESLVHQGGLESKVAKVIKEHLVSMDRLVTLARLDLRDLRDH